MTKNVKSVKSVKNVKSAKVENVNNVSFIESANELLKSVSKDLRNANKESASISRTLKDMQRAFLLDAGYKVVFEKLGLPTNGKVTAKMFFESLSETQKGIDKKGNTFVGIWGYKVERDANGNVISKERVLRKVTAWSANKVFKVFAQSITIKNESK